MVRLVASLTGLLGAWILATALVSAQVSLSGISDALLGLPDLPQGFRATGPVASQFPPIEGLEQRSIAFERDPGPVVVISAIARAHDATSAASVYRLMVDGAVADGVKTTVVPLLGDEAIGLSAPQTATFSGSGHRYVFRKGDLLASITLYGPLETVTLDDAIGLAIVASGHLDTALASAPMVGSEPVSPIAAPGNGSRPSGMPTPAARPPVSAPMIVGESTFDAPSVSGNIMLGGFSGLQSMDATGNRFAVLTDRGPNVFFRGRNQAVFAVPDFSPRILIVTVDGDNIRLTDSIPFRLPEGYVSRSTGSREISGISTGDHDGPGYTLSRERLPYDPYGVDSEGLARDPRDGSFWVADEYGPSILHTAPDGTVLQRIVPMGLGLDAPGENVTELLPAAFTKRKANRGFEGIAISPDGSRVYAIMQSPLANPDRKTGEGSRIHRIVALDTSGPDVTLQGVYLYQAEAYSHVKAKEQDDIKVGDMAAVSATRLLVAERDSVEGGPHRMVYAVDLADATNVRSRDTVSGKTLEQVSESDLSKADIKLARKDPVVDLAKLGFRAEKFEGLAIVDDTTLAITADNDFGLEEADRNGEIAHSDKPSRIALVRLSRSIR